MEIEKYAIETFENIKHIDENGVEFWYARELQKVLEYTKWDNFKNIIEKAKDNLKTNKINVFNHFAEVSKTIQMPKNATKEIEDIKLTRYACYIIVQNGDPRKETIAQGQKYFALQTRKQEIQKQDFENLTENEKRLLIRKDTRQYNKMLFESAKNCGIKDNMEYAIFNNFGYRGLYGGETAKDIKERKGLNKNEEILDNMGSTELVANLFRITQTDERLKKGDITDKNIANKTHYTIGKKIRETMEEISGILPENLPTPEKSIKQLEKEKVKQEKLEQKKK